MTEPFIVDSQHSELGPSASERWLECTGSVLLTRGMKKGSWYAAEGNAAHTVAEWARKQNVPAAAFLGRVLVVDDFEFTVDDEMAAGVQTFVDYVAKLPGYPLYEVRVRYDRWVRGGFGTMDDGRLQDSVCYVTDFKFGKGVKVFAENNSQLKLYGVGLQHDLNWLWDFDKFVLTIVQPRLNHIDQWETDWKTLREWMQDEVAPKAEIAMLPGAPLKASNGCMFCPAKLKCGAYAVWHGKNKLGGGFVPRRPEVDVSVEFQNLDAGEWE